MRCSADRHHRDERLRTHPTPVIGQTYSRGTPLSTMREVWLQGYDEVVFDRPASQAYAAHFRQATGATGTVWSYWVRVCTCHALM